MGDENTDEKRTIASELSMTPDEDKKDCLKMNGFKVDFAIVKKKNGKDEGAVEEEQLELLAVRNGRYFCRYLSNQQAHEISTKTSKISKNVPDIYDMLCEAVGGAPSLEAEISDEGMIKFKSLLKYPWSKKAEEDYLAIQLEEEHLDPLELIRRLLKSSYLDTTSLNIFNNFLDSSEEVKKVMATKIELGNLEESFQRLFNEVKDSIVKVETLITTTRNEVTEWKTSQTTEITSLKTEVAGLKTAQTADANAIKAAQTEIGGIKTEMAGIKTVQTTAQGEINTLKTAQAADANGIRAIQGEITTLKTDITGLKTAQTNDNNGLRAAQTEITGLKTTLATLQTKVTTLETSLAAVKAQQQNPAQA